MESKLLIKSFNPSVRETVVNVPFRFRGKMDRFCSAVAALNRMGVPVVAPLPGRDS